MDDESRHLFESRWTEYKKGLFVAKSALEEFERVQTQRAQSRAYMDKLRERLRIAT